MSPVYNRIDIKGYRVLECERQEQLFIHLAPSKRTGICCPFHVIRVVIHHFMALCRQIAPEIKNSSGSLAVLRKNPHNLAPPQMLRLDRLLAAYPAFVPLYEQMHRLRDLLNRKHQSRRSCKPLTRELLAFIDRLAASCLEPLITLANTLRSWAEPIACM